MTKNHLIIGGADGEIGKAVADALENSGHSCLMTSRHSDRSPIPPLSLECPPESWLPDRRFETVFICAGPSPSSCAADPAQAWRMMVEGRRRFAREFTNRGAFVVALSTNAVFDGMRAFETIEAPTAPRGVYGEVHANFDNSRADFEKSLCIVRLTKVATHATGTFRNWRAAAAAGAAIVAPSDFRVSPVTLPFAASLIVRCGLEKRPGLFNCSGDRDIDYFSAALAFAERAGLPAKFVSSRCASELGIDPNLVTRYSSLDMSQTVEAFGVAGQSFEDVADFIAQV